MRSPISRQLPDEAKPVKGRQHEVVQHRLERDRRIFGQRIPQCQRTVRRQFNDEPIWQRPCRVFIILLGFGRYACDRDRCARCGTASLLPFSRRRIGARLDIETGRRRLILRPNIAPIDGKPSFGIEADEDAGPGNLGRIVSFRPVFERQQRRLDVAETLVHLFGKLIRILILGFELRLLGVQSVDGGLLLQGEIDRFALYFAQAIRMAVGEIDGERNPLPAFGCDRLGLALSFSVTRRSSKAMS